MNNKWKAVIALAALASACLLIAGLAVLGSGGDDGGTEGKCFTDDARRLAENGFLPSSYNITWMLDPDNDSFKGHVVIEGVMFNSSGCLWLNSVELEHHSIQLRSTDNAGKRLQHQVTGSKYLPTSQVIAYQLDRQLPAQGNLTIEIEFSAELGHDMIGLYVSTFGDEGNLQQIISTQFEATYARRAFPCLDDPDLKATFAIQIQGVPEGHTALSNMPLAPDRCSVANCATFEPTVRMSTYLVAVVVGPLERVMTTVQSTAGTPLDISVWAREGFGHKLQFALETAAIIIPYYEQFYSIPYPLPKCDLVAIPDFAAGAMENWGLVTFRETALLANESTSSQRELQRVAVVVSHELAHQWFGNLVTMEWWSELWLNEGFASFVEFIGVDKAWPQFRIWSTFLGGNPQEAMPADSFATSHALTATDVKTSGQIEAMFDSISYSKGASVIRMVQHHLNSQQANTFEAGINEYLEDHAFGNARSGALWAALADAAADPELVTKMTGYTVRPGVPMVLLTESAEGLAISQRRFFVSPASAKQAGEPDDTWWVPLTVEVERPGKDTTLDAAISEINGLGGFSSKALSTKLGYNATLAGWLKVNVNQTGYYRVLYTDEMVKEFAAAIAAPQRTLPSADRAGVVDDVCATFFSGDFTGAEGLSSLLSALKMEEELEVWTPALHCISELVDLAQPAPCAEAADAWAAGLVEVAAERLSWVAGINDTVPTQLLRPALLSAAVEYNVTSIVSEGLGRFRSYISGSGDHGLTPNTRVVAFEAAVRWLSENEGYDRVKGIYLSSTDPAERTAALNALALTPDRSVAQALLDFSLSEEVRKQDAPTLISRIAAVYNSRDLVWDFFKEKFDEFDSRYGSGGFAIEKLVANAAGRFMSDAKYSDIESFFKSHPLPAAARQVSQALESIRASADWRSSMADTLCDMF